MAGLDTKVLIVGCGAAGVTAALGLARRRIPVVVVEGAPHPGAENWSGAVYFCENLARPDILGEEMLLQTPLERRVVQRGLLMTDGHLAPGFAVHSPEAFRHCYTVLRPIFDHDLAEKARLFGAEILAGTQVLALLRDGDRVRGVLTDRGPITAEVVFLAEGDASNLVTREGLETKRPTNGLVRPEFLQGVKEVLELPSRVIEERFGVLPGDGACYEILLRNGTFNGSPVPLNAGAFLYTNRESLSLGFVAPLENLKTFGGEHNTLMEWIKGLPALAPLIEGAKPISFGAKLIRGGGWNEMPRLVLDGLAVGGAASGLGLDFPCPNYTGPATFTGWAFAQSVEEIIRRKGPFSRDALETYYVSKVHQSSYARDVYRLRAWPHYVASTRVFFGSQVDLLVGSVRELTCSDAGWVRRKVRFWRHVAKTLPLRGVWAFASDLRRAGKALGLLQGLWKDVLLLAWRWTINLFVGWFRWPEALGIRGVPLLIGSNPSGRRKAPLFTRWLLWRLGPGVGEALHHLYRNDGTTLEERLPLVRRSILSRLNWIDLIVIPLWAALVWVLGGLVKLLAAQSSGATGKEGNAPQDLGGVRALVSHDTKLSWLSYTSVPSTHIRFHGTYDARGLPTNAGSPLFSVCPARVYQAEHMAGTTAVAVLHENCIRCETCWRADPERVDWGRTRGQRLVFEAYSSADAWLSESRNAAGLVSADREHRPYRDAEGSPQGTALPDDVRTASQRQIDHVAGLVRGFLALTRHLPSVLMGADRVLLQSLGQEILNAVAKLEQMLSGVGLLGDRVTALAAWREQAATRLPSNRFFHLEADFELLRSWHLKELVRRTDLHEPKRPEPSPAGPRREALRRLVEERLTREELAAVEEGLAPTPSARRFILELASGLLRSDGTGPARPGAAARDATLEELAALAPSLAVLLAGHLAALDILFHGDLAEARPGALEAVIGDLLKGRLLALVVDGERATFRDGILSGDLGCVLAGGVDLFFVVNREGAFLAAPTDEGVSLGPAGAIGLRGAGPARLRCDHVAPREVFRGDGGRRHLRVRAPWDLVAVVRGMARALSLRALDHAASRVQFPGTFQDHRGRDSIAKFGAVQEMLSGIGQAVEVLESLRGQVGHGRAALGLALELLGCSPRSVAYLAGQVLGGTAYSEEDSVCRFYRDASALTRLPFAASELLVEHGHRVLAGLAPGSSAMPDIELHVGETTWPKDLPKSLAPSLSDLTDEIRNATRGFKDLGPESRAALVSDLGRLGLHVLGARLLAQRVAQGLHRGDADTVPLTALIAYSRRAARRAALLARRLPDVPHLMELGALLLKESSTEGPVGAHGATYAEYLEDGSAFTSGDLFLQTKGDAALGYTPELQEADGGLWQKHQTYEHLWKSRFRARDFDGRPYTRHVEFLHRVPSEDLEFLLEGGFFRMTIPRSQGGLGAKKALYYLACVHMMRHGDPTQALIVMGSTSIGTSPILLGKAQLEDARSELQGALDKAPRVAALVPRLRDLSAELERGRTHLAGEAASLVTEVEATIRSKLLRRLFTDVSRNCKTAKRSLELGDSKDSARCLRHTADLLESFEQRLQEQVRDFPHREAAHDFFLGLIASGRISAFALTEPSAGSDTARIRTRADRCDVPAQRDPRGFFTFIPEGSTEVKNLFDYGSFDFKDGVLSFIRPDRHRVPVQVQDFPQHSEERGPGAEARFRYVVLDGERVDIHDLGRAERRGAEWSYAYFRVQGAKMWITNGSVAGVMILYAKTPEGPTGFMLDAHAEGLVVGKDEHKMGQRGTATNELALNDVRVPVDQIIGLEGRGQENALETLNVGRAGLAMCSTALMHEVVSDLRRAFCSDALAPHQLLELGRVALDVVASESLAFDVVGRFDHPGTRSIRLESAAAKAFCTEAYHRILTRAERLLPASYALDSEEMEKRRRDARVLTIYEGTNEIQRFLILRDLVDGLELDASTGAPRKNPQELGAVDATRDAVLERLREVRQRLGSAAWQTATYQPWMFQLVDVVTKLCALSATAHRQELAGRLLKGDEGEVRREFLDLAADLLGRDLRHLEVTTWRDFEWEGRRTRAGEDAFHHVMSDRLLLRHAQEPESETTVLGHRFERLLKVAVIVDPRPALAPRPRVRDGRVQEHAMRLSDEDRGALVAALGMKAAGPCDISVIGVGRASGVSALRETLALGADRAFLLNTGARNLMAPDLAEALSDLVSVREDLDAPFDVILGSQSSSGLLVPLARRLGRVPLWSVRDLGITETAEGLEMRAVIGDGPPVQIMGPSLLMVFAPMPSHALEFDVLGWSRARRLQVSLIDYTPSRHAEIRLEAGTKGDEGPETRASVSTGLGVEEAASRFVEATGLAQGAEEPASFEGAVHGLGADQFLKGLSALAVVTAKTEGASKGLRGTVLAARQIAQARQGEFGVLVLLGAFVEETVRRAAGEILAVAGEARVGFIADDRLDVRAQTALGGLLEQLLCGFAPPVVFESVLRVAALGCVEGRSMQRGVALTLLDGVDRLHSEGGDICVFGPRFEGKLRFSARRPLIDFGIHLIVHGDFLSESQGGGSAGTVAILEDVNVDTMADDAMARVLRSAQSALGVSLSDAEFIIDVGYGVGSRDGIEEVIEPLRQGLERLGIPKVSVGATRKVTMDLGILPAATQIGQTGVSVSPKVLLAIGVSGAPQHLNYIGDGAVIFAFNKDASAPLMVLNESRSLPRVYPIHGDLFREVPRFLAALSALLQKGQRTVSARSSSGAS